MCPSKLKPAFPITQEKLEPGNGGSCGIGYEPILHSRYCKLILVAKGLIIHCEGVDSSKCLLRFHGSDSDEKTEMNKDDTLHARHRDGGSRYSKIEKRTSLEILNRRIEAFRWGDMAKRLINLALPDAYQHFYT